MKIIILLITISLFMFSVAVAEGEYPTVFNVTDEEQSISVEGLEGQDLPAEIDTSVLGEDYPENYGYEERYDGFDIDQYESDNPFDYGYEEADVFGGEGSKRDSTDMMGVDEYTYGDNWDRIYEEREYRYYGEQSHQYE